MHEAAGAGAAQQQQTEACGQRPRAGGTGARRAPAARPVSCAAGTATGSGRAAHAAAPGAPGERRHAPRRAAPRRAAPCATPRRNPPPPPRGAHLAPRAVPCCAPRMGGSRGAHVGELDALKQFRSGGGGGGAGGRGGSALRATGALTGARLAGRRVERVRAAAGAGAAAAARPPSRCKLAAGSHGLGSSGSRARSSPAARAPASTAGARAAGRKTGTPRAQPHTAHCKAPGPYKSLTPPYRTPARSAETRRDARGPPRPADGGVGGEAREARPDRRRRRAPAPRRGAPAARRAPPAARRRPRPAAPARRGPHHSTPRRRRRPTGLKRAAQELLRELPAVRRNAAHGWDKGARRAAPPGAAAARFPRHAPA
jgi:hypothetical protein